MKKIVKTIPDLIENDRIKGRDAFEQLKNKLSKTSFKNKENLTTLLHNELTSGINNELNIIYQQRQVPWKVIFLNFIMAASISIIYLFPLQNNTSIIKLLYISISSLIVILISIIATIVLYRINFNSHYHRIVSNTQKELKNRITEIDSVIESYIIKNFSEYIIEINQIKNNNTTQNYLSLWQYFMLWITALLSIFIMIYGYIKNI